MVLVGVAPTGPRDIPSPCPRIRFWHTWMTQTLPARTQASFDPPGLSIAVKKDRAVENLLLTGNRFNINILKEGGDKVRKFGVARDGGNLHLVGPSILKGGCGVSARAWPHPRGFSSRWRRVEAGGCERFDSDKPS